MNQNAAIADALEHLAVLLEARQASPFRIRAYRRAAENIRAERLSLAEIFRSQGRKGLTQLPGIGKSIGSAVEEFLLTGHIEVAGRIQAGLQAEEVFTLVPGIGKVLAHIIYHKLNIHSLEELEMAAHDGRLEQAEGFGPRRTRAIQQHLNVMLRRASRLRAAQYQQRAGTKPQYEDPDVKTLLEIDALYRQKAAEGQLRLIAPRRFNPEGKAWLPILRCMYHGWLFTVMYSNTAQAHKWNKTHDWVVIFFEKQGEEQQCTVVTEWQGPLAGKRVVRGRPAECLAHYIQQEAA
ncbi:MAG: DNA-binding protein [Bacteroidetes bacterium]|nr:MAG: DNA-binding protein [Bacteroidota bacterium]